MDLRSARSFVGWDGTGARTLTLNGTLRVGASITLVVNGCDDRMRAGSEVWGAGGFRGVVDWVEKTTGNSGVSAPYHIHLREVTGTPVVGETWTGDPVLDPETKYDETFDPNIHDHADPRWHVIVTPTGTIAGVINHAMPKIAPFVSGIYGAQDPTVTATVNLGADFALDLSRVDLLPAGTYDLIGGPGVTVTNNGATLPAGVTVTGGRLVLTKA